MAYGERTAVSVVAPHVLAALAAVAASFLMIVSLAGFGDTKSLLTVLALPAIVAAIAVPGKARKLLFLTIAILPFLAVPVPPRRYGIDVGDVAIALLALLAASEIALGKSERLAWRRTVFTVPLLCMLGAVTMTCALGVDPPLAFKELVSNVGYILFYVIFLRFVKTKDDLDLAIKLVLLGFVPSAFLGLAQYFLHIGLELNPDITGNTHFTAEDIETVRAFGSFSESLTFAQYLIPPVSLLAAFALYARHLLWRAAWSAGFALGSLALIVTLSRGSWAAWLVAVAVVFLLWIPKKALAYVLWWPVAAALAVVAYWEMLRPLVPSGIAARAETFGHDFENGRGILWTAGIAIFRDHPLFGVGLRGLIHVLPLYDYLQLGDVFFVRAMGTVSENTRGVGHVHLDNFYLTTLDEVGLVGMIPVMLVLALALWQAYRNFAAAPAELRPYALGVLGGLVGTLMVMTSTYGYGDERLALLTWMMLAMTVVLRRLVAAADAPMDAPALSGAGIAPAAGQEATGSGRHAEAGADDGGRGRD